jgi:hypothetical protein
LSEKVLNCQMSESKMKCLVLRCVGKL